MIMHMSGRLPVWLAALAAALPTDLADLGDPAADAGELFLKWEDDPVGVMLP